MGIPSPFLDFIMAGDISKEMNLFLGRFHFKEHSVKIFTCHVWPGEEFLLKENQKALADKCLFDY